MVVDELLRQLEAALQSHSIPVKNRALMLAKAFLTPQQEAPPDRELPSAVMSRLGPILERDSELFGKWKGRLTRGLFSAANVPYETVYVQLGAMILEELNARQPLGVNDLKRFIRERNADPYLTADALCCLREAGLVERVSDAKKPNVPHRLTELGSTLLQ